MRSALEEREKALKIEKVFGSKGNTSDSKAEKEFKRKKEIKEGGKEQSDLRRYYRKKKGRASIAWKKKDKEEGVLIKVGTFGVQEE